METRRLFLCLLLVGPVSAGAAPAQSQRAFFNDFDSGASGGGVSGGWVADVQGLAGLGRGDNRFAGRLFHNTTGTPGLQPTRLTLWNLPQHTSIDLNFLLAVINTWDGEWDYLTVKVDGREVFKETFSTWDASLPVYDPPEGALLTPRSPFGFPNLGFGDSWGTQAYDMSLEPRLHNIPHTSDRLLVELSAQEGFTGGGDESFGIDNVEVVLNGVVPEPSVLAPALAAPLALRRRRRRGRRA